MLALVVLDVLVALNVIIVIALIVLHVMLLVRFFLIVFHAMIVKLVQVHVLYVMQNVIQIIKYYFYIFLIVSFDHLSNTYK